MPRGDNRIVELINISLIHLGASSLLDDTCLGVVTIPVDQWPDMRLPTLRAHLKCQLSSVLPETYIFCSKERFEILQEQEGDILGIQICNFSSTILIRNRYDIPKLIVRSHSGMHHFGHIFCSFTASLTELREIIHSNCPNISGPSKMFHFLYTDGSVVTASMEGELPVHEILSKHTVHVQVKEMQVEDIPEETGIDIIQLKRKSQENFEHSRTKGLRLSFSSSKDIERQSSNDSTASSHPTRDNKQLLISYVRAEAAEHALKLKKKLINLGFSVYLDVHEIKSGIDWQDSLNYAVSNCEVFIPLVTPRYGETQWTNREVKLADVLGKPIIPISFLEEWPPRCLAIQFATTQYIHWKTPEQVQIEISTGTGAEAKDIRIWKSKYIEAVAKEIELRLKSNKSGMVSMSKPALNRMKTLIKTFAGRLPDLAAPVLSTHEPEETSGPQVVICLHPEETNFGLKIKSWLEEEGHSVWVTTNRGEYGHSHESDVVTPSQDMGDDSMEGDKEKSESSLDSSVNISVKQVAEFQEAVDRASLVIVILSKAFSQSKICRQEVFYCEHRKQILPVVYDDFRFPCWLKMLIRTQRLLSINKTGFHKTLLMQVKRALDPTAKNCLESDSQEANINLAVHYLRKSVKVQQCVYVTGASKFYSSKSEAVCRSIGRQLATLGNIALVTGGCYGTSELVSRVFHEESQKQSKTSAVWHVLPEQDTQDVGEQYNQSSDGTFALKDFGKTLFCGNSVWEKEAIVGRCFQICLLIEGGPHSAHEVEEFVWSDHIVVPVCCPNGAAFGDFKVTDKMYQLPPGVNESDWLCLNEKMTPSEEIGHAVSRVIMALLKQLTQEDEKSPPPNSATSSEPQTPNVTHEENVSFSGDTGGKVIAKKSETLIAKLRTLQTINVPPH